MRGLFILALSLVLASCQTASRSQTHSALTISAGWDGVRECFRGVRYYYGSPEFTVTGIPEGTAHLQFTLRHVDAGIFHTQETIPYTGGEVIPPNQFEYLGPCPQPPGGSYAWTIVAFNDDKSIELGRGVLPLEFPPKEE